MQYFPDRFVKKEISNLEVICIFSEDGCNWEGKFNEDYFHHKSICRFRSTTSDLLMFPINASPTQSINGHSHELVEMQSWEQQCPLQPLGCSNETFMDSNELTEHLQEDKYDHLMMIANCIQLLTEKIQRFATTRILPNTERRHQDLPLEIERQEYHSVPSQQSDESNNFIAEKMQEMKAMLMLSIQEEFKVRDKEISSGVEEQIRSKKAELEDCDFRLSLIENSNHDGTMIWKIPQFSQRKADAENGKYTSIFSLPFYSGKYGYKMCLHLYIMGDGIGKGTHLSLFFVVMRGEFDNILQWPFTHKVTFKLINQAGGRDIIDTFQPDPMSTSFRKPKCDMNVASGCPRFVSHTELEGSGFIDDDTIFIKCSIDTSTIRHP
jgi:hypothetical protein